MPAVRRAAALSLGAGAAGLAWATLVERHWYAVRRATLPVLAPGSRPLRVLHVSDLHLVPRQEHRICWVQALAGLDPDLVVNTGDNCSDLDAVPAVLRAFEPLLGVPGCFVLGSNDYFAPKPKNPLRYFNASHRRGEELGTPRLPVHELIAGFEGGGWINLTHRRTTAQIRGVPIELVGVDDPHLDYDRYDEVAAPASREAALTLGVLHAPYTRVLDAMSADGAQLLLAGHTHGGQLAVPGYGALVTNCDLDRGRARGVSRWWPGAGRTTAGHPPLDASWLNVSAGLGHSKYAPARFACRPEASLLMLVAKDSDPIS